MKFPQNIRWQCIKCAMCCGDTKRHIRKVLLIDKETSEIASFIGLKLDDFSRHTTGNFPYTREVKKIGGKCFFLKDGRCSIYDKRPLVCIFYPFGLNGKGGIIEFKLTGEPCKGLGKGKTVKEELYRDLLELAIQRLGSMATVISSVSLSYR